VKYLYVRAAAFRLNPLRGSEIDTSWLDFANQFSDCSRADTKDAGGAWSALNFATASSVRPSDSVLDLVADIDEGGDVRKIADRLRAVSAIVHETFSSTLGRAALANRVSSFGATARSQTESAHAAVSARLNRLRDRPGPRVLRPRPAFVRSVLRPGATTSWR